MTAMRIEKALLSARFADDGRAETPLSGPSAELAAQLRRDLSAPGALVSHPSCPLCGGTEVLGIADKDRNGLPLPLVLCHDCGLVFAASVPTPQAAARYYSGFAHVFKTQTRTAAELFAQRTQPGAFAWTRHAFVTSALGEGYDRVRVVAEIGCSDGCNLLPYARDGRRVVGCDLDGLRVAEGRKAGLDLREGPFLDDLIGQVDLLILSHVIEHLVDVPAFLARAVTLLAPGGVIYAEIPGIGMIRSRGEWWSTDGYGASNDLLGYLQFEHNYAFDLTTLSAFAARAGLVAEGGDEVARTLLRPGAAGIALPRGRGPEVLARLRAAEADRQRAEFPGKQILRRVVRALRKMR